MFDNLKRLSINSEMTAELTLYRVEGEPVLILAPANEVNKPYFNELLRMSRKGRTRSAASLVNAAVIKENRDNDRELYPRFVIRGWRRVRGSDGKEVEATPENVRAFCDQLPDWLFDEVRTFAMEIENFIPSETTPEEVSGNS